MNVNLVRIWDLPTRLFHGALILAFVGLVATAQIGGSAMEWHFRRGYTVLALLLFRVVWGWVGGYWSRFAQFVSSPAAALAYARTPFEQRLPSLGHNPMGAWSVLAILLAMGLQVTAGLFSDDEIATAGPLASYASSQWVSLATRYHTSIGKLAVFALLALHVATALYYRYKRKVDLITPMVSGDKLLPAGTRPSKDSAGTRVLALVVLGLIAVGVGVLLP
jgi:cytochrome b